MGMSHRGRLNVMVNTFGKSRRRHLFQVRRCEPTQHPGRRRREIPRGRYGSVSYPNRGKHGLAPGFEPQSPGSRGSGCHGPCTRPASADRRSRPDQGAAGAHPWRCGVCRPGHLGRNDESRHHARLYRGRHHPDHRQQPDRLYRRPGGVLFVALLLRHRQAPADSYLPRERRRCRRRDSCRHNGGRIPLYLPHRCDHRPDRLPPPRAQRGGRPDHHPADSLRAGSRIIRRSTRSMPGKSAWTPRRGSRSCRWSLLQRRSKRP